MTGVPIAPAGASRVWNAVRTARAGAVAITPAMAPARSGRWVGPASRPWAWSILSMEPSHFLCRASRGLFQHRLDSLGSAEVSLEEAHEVLIGEADGSRIAVEVEQANRIDVAERLPQRDVPI